MEEDDGDQVGTASTLVDGKTKSNLVPDTSGDHGSLAAGGSQVPESKDPAICNGEADIFDCKSTDGKGCPTLSDDDPTPIQKNVPPTPVMNGCDVSDDQPSLPLLADQKAPTKDCSSDAIGGSSEKEPISDQSFLDDASLSLEHARSRDPLDDNKSDSLELGSNVCGAQVDPMEVDQESENDAARSNEASSNVDCKDNEECMDVQSVNGRVSLCESDQLKSSVDDTEDPLTGKNESESSDRTRASEAHSSPAAIGHDDKQQSKSDSNSAAASSVKDISDTEECGRLKPMSDVSDTETCPPVLDSNPSSVMTGSQSVSPTCPEKLDNSSLSISPSAEKHETSSDCEHSSENLVKNVRTGSPTSDHKLEEPLKCVIPPSCEKLAKNSQLRSPSNNHLNDSNTLSPVSSEKLVQNSPQLSPVNEKCVNDSKPSSPISSEKLENSQVSISSEKLKNSQVSISSETLGSDSKPSNPSSCEKLSSSHASPGKSTARKSVPGRKLFKATARKTGRPQIAERGPADKDSAEGTIKVNLSSSSKSNITLKLSELENVLKVTNTGAKSNVKESSPASERDAKESEKSVLSDSAHDSLDSLSKKSGLKKKRKKKSGYDFPGGRKLLKKSRKLLDGEGDVNEDEYPLYKFNPLKKVIKKSGASPYRQQTVVEFLKAQPLQRRLTASGSVINIKNAGSSGPMAQQREREGVEDGGASRDKKQMVLKLFVSSTNTPDGYVSSVNVEEVKDADTENHGRRLSSGSESLKLHRPFKRKSDDFTSQGKSGISGEQASKKQRVSEAGGAVTAAGGAPLVMVVAQHNQSAPGLRSILPKPNSTLTVSGASLVAVPHSAPKLVSSKMLSSSKLVSSSGKIVSSKIVSPPGALSSSAQTLLSSSKTLPTSSFSKILSPSSAAKLLASSSSMSGSSSSKLLPTTKVIFTTSPSSSSSSAPTLVSPTLVSSGQKLLLPSGLMKPGTKVALIPMGKNPFALPGSSVVTSQAGAGLAKVVSISSSVAQNVKSNDALRALLSQANGPKAKTISLLPPGAVQVVSRASVVSAALAQSRVITTSATLTTATVTTSTVTAAKSAADGGGRSGLVMPNGLLPVTPPKTPEGEAAVEGMSTAPDSDVIPLCCCRIGGAVYPKSTAGPIFCQALDSVDGKALGCCTKVSNLQLARSGVKIPFMAVCEAHRKRLKHHQCCPGCGQFCSQGKFYQCSKDTASNHHFHRQCQIEKEGRLFCPHCGEESSQVEVTLSLSEPKPAAQSSEQIRANLKKSISRARMMPSNAKKKAEEASAGVSVTLPNSKTVSSGGLPAGLERDALQHLLNTCILKTERPKKFRVLPKNMYLPACDGDLDKVFYMLMDGMDPNQICEEEDNQTILHGAVYSGSVPLVYLLIQSGACIHTPDKNLKTPLMCAAEYGHLEVLKMLCRAGARLDDRGEDRMTCLHFAAKAGHLEVIQYLLDQDTLEIDLPDEGGWTPMMWATESKLVDIVKFLVSKGGDPNKKDNEENTVLHWAAFAGSLEIAELCMELGCELDSPNEHGDRPLHICARQDHYEMIVVLLARGANVNLRNNKDETPIACCPNQESLVAIALRVNRQLRIFASRISRPERLVHRDLSLGREKNPIACVNAIDNERAPSDYLYVNHNILTQDLHVNTLITSLQSCRCQDDCSSVFCVCSRSSVKCWFDKFGRLLEEFNIMDPPLIFECNRACRCWVNCNNRVVQNGITVRMQVFRTTGRGWGVRSLMDIPKGTFICEYIGEMISDSEADRREDDSYLFDLDNKDGDTYCLDARKFGNVARFINHLCEPNLIPVKVFVDHQDLRFPRICFFSSREIKAYEEFGFDYGEKFWIIKWKQFTCACGSPKCRYSTETIKRTLEEYRLRHEEENQAAAE